MAFWSCFACATIVSRFLFDPARVLPPRGDVAIVKTPELGFDLREELKCRVHAVFRIRDGVALARNDGPLRDASETPGEVVTARGGLSFLESAVLSSKGCALCETCGVSTCLADPQRYDRTPYARCGRSGLKLPRISLGLWHNFVGDDPFDNQRALARGATLAQLSTLWLLRRPEITNVQIGASKVSQIVDIQNRVTQPPLAQEELNRIEKILAGG